MAAALGDAAVFQHQDLVGMDDGGQPVGDHQGGGAPADFPQALLDGKLGMAVQGRCRLVEDRNRRGRFRMARAMATRCFSPPDSFSPRSPTIVS